SIEGVGDGFTKAGQSMRALSAVAAGLLASFSAIGISAVGTASELSDLAKMFEMNTEEVQKWQYVALQSSVSSQELENALKKIQQGLSGIKTGNIDKIGQAMMELGISAEDATKGTSENFEVLIRRIGMIEDPLVRAQYATDLFGASMGANLLPLLRQNAEGLDDVIDEWNSFSHITDENMQQLDEVSNAFNRITTQFNNLKVSMGHALLPIIENVTDFIENKVIPAVDRLVNWFTNLDEGTKKLIVTLLTVTAAIAPTLLAIGGGIKLVASLTKTVKMLGTAMSALAANPIIAVIGIIAALLVYLISTNEEFRDSIMRIVSAYGDILAPILDVIMSLLNAILDVIKPLVDILGQALVPVIDLVGKYLQKVGDIIQKYVVPVFEFLVEVINVVSKVITGIFEGIIKIVEKIVNKIIDFINNIIKGINSVSKYLGMTIPELKNVEMNVRQTVDSQVSGEITQGKNKPQTSSDYVRDSIEGWQPSSVVNNETNYDYSQKDIKIEVIVQNYAEEVDVDDMVRQINIKLAEQL
ncbi:MAG: phage tail tape measure protein, partial [Bacilli bacterium]